MANIFAGQYKLTNEIYKAPVVLFTEDDSEKIYCLKNRYPDNEPIKRYTQPLSYFDIPREFFENSKALVGYDYINVGNGDNEIIKVLKITVNGPLFRSYTFGTNEYHGEDFIQKMRDRDEEMKHDRGGVQETIGGNTGDYRDRDNDSRIEMEESSETIETESEKVDVSDDDTGEFYCESCQIHLPED